MHRIDAGQVNVTAGAKKDSGGHHWNSTRKEGREGRRGGRIIFLGSAQ